jgi:unsaturated rhamnogalacturonyl hydrolase
LKIGQAPALPSREERLFLLEKIGKSLVGMPYKSWNFGDSTGFEGILETGRLLKDPTYLAFASGWIRAWASRPEPFKPLDCTAPGVAMVEVAHETKDPVIIESLNRLALYLMSRPKNREIFETWETFCLLSPYGGEELPENEAQWLANPPGGTCIDCLHFDPPFFTALGKETGNKDFINVGVQQAHGYIDELQKENGIFDHFFMNGIPGTWAPGWGRGQGWALLGMLDVLKHISLEHPGRKKIESAATKLIYSMIELQREDGRWWCVVDSERSGEEGSTAGFMATGFARAIKLGIVDESIVRPAMIKALAGVIADTNPDGELQNVTAAVYASTRKSHYEFTPRGFSVPWGQGPVALAICETDALL